MTIDNWFVILMTIGIWLAGLLLLDGAHRAHISELKRGHSAELAGMRTYIRTLNRERKWLEAELAKYKEKVRQREDELGAAPAWMPAHIFLPPSEEYDSGEE
jgi:vacuolar-type H+-ATPase subunit I/STV1